MHDCKIPANTKSRDVDIKKYVEKLEELEKEFETCEQIVKESTG